MRFLQATFRGLWRRPARILFPAISVAIGAASVLMVFAAGSVGKQTVCDEMRRLGLGQLLVTPQDETALTARELEHIRQSNVVQTASPLIQTNGTIFSIRGDKNCIVNGVDETGAEQLYLSVCCGRFFQKSDLVGARPVCLVDSRYATATYGRKNIVGKKISLTLSQGQLFLTVVGVIDVDASPLRRWFSEEQQTQLYLPYSLLRRADGEDAFCSIAVQVAPGVEVQKARAVLSGALSRQCGKDSFWIRNTEQQSRQLQGVVEKITDILSVLAGVSLLVSGISVMTVMLFSVGERTREIGLRKALGAGSGDILFSFLAQALLMTSLGFLMGLAFGVLGGTVLCRVLGATFFLTRRQVLLCLSVTGISGLLFGIYPAIRAARLRPAVALRRG